MTFYSKFFLVNGSSPSSGCLLREDFPRPGDYIDVAVMSKTTTQIIIWKKKKEQTLFRNMWNKH